MPARLVCVGYGKRCRIVVNRGVSPWSIWEYRDPLWTLMDIYGILKESFAESGLDKDKAFYGVRNPASMAFGGRDADPEHMGTKLGNF